MNLYAPIQSLQKSPVATGGLCSLKYFRWEDVAVWPDYNPITGIMAAAIQLKPGGVIFICEAVDKGRSFDEEQKQDVAGPYMDIEVNATLAGSNSANGLSLDRMKHHRWGLILEDRNGVTRLVGNKDNGAKFSYKYSSGDIATSRKALLKFNWQFPNSAPQYGGNAFNISIGGNIIVAGSLLLIMRFRVGAPGAPMVDGNTTLVNAGFANKNLLVIASGSALAVDDESGSIDFTGSIERHYHKLFNSNTITFIGGVTDKEIIEIYAWN